MSKLSDYISDQQNTALRIAGLLDAILCLKDSPGTTEEAQYCVTSLAHELADNLCANLDSARIREVTQHD